MFHILMKREEREREKRRGVRIFTSYTGYDDYTGSLRKVKWMRKKEQGCSDREKKGGKGIPLKFSQAEKGKNNLEEKRKERNSISPLGTKMGKTDGTLVSREERRGQEGKMNTSAPLSQRGEEGSIRRLLPILSCLFGRKEEHTQRRRGKEEGKGGINSFANSIKRGRRGDRRISNFLILSNAGKKQKKKDKRSNT